MRVFCHLLDVDLDVLLQVVAVQVQHKVVNVVETIADNDQWQLVGQLRLLQVSIHDTGKQLQVALSYRYMTISLSTSCMNIAQS